MKSRFADHRCNCDASCGENRYHDAGDHGCRFESAEEFEAYWQNIHDTNEKWVNEQLKKKDKTTVHKPYLKVPEVDPDYDTEENLRKTIVNLRNELARNRDALKTIGALFQQMPTVKENNVVLAWDIVDGTLNGTWPAYGIVPKAAKTYEPKTNE